MEPNLAQPAQAQTAYQAPVLQQNPIIPPQVATVQKPKVSHKKRNFLILFLGLAVFVVLVSIYAVNLFNHQWTIYKNVSGFSIGDGRFANIITPVFDQKFVFSGGDTSSRDVTVEIYNPKTNQKKDWKIFSKIPFFTTVKFLPDEANKNLWILQDPQQECSFKGSNTNNQYCKTLLYKFDYNSGQKTLIKEFEFAPNRYMTPLTIDATNHSIWFTYYYNLSVMSDNQKAQTIASETAVLFDINTKKTTSYKINSYPDGFGDIFKSGVTDRKIADTDQNGNLFLLTAAETGNNGSNTSSSSNIVMIDVNKNEVRLISTPPLKDSNGNPYPFWDGEMAADKRSGFIYLVNDSWDGNQNSTFLKYDIQKNTFENLGGIPTRTSDDVRGFAVFDGKLLAGFFDGLGVLDPNDKTWKVVNKNYGLLQSQVKNILIIQNKICVTHENPGLSCLNIPLWLEQFIVSNSKKVKTTSYSSSSASIPVGPISTQNWKTYTDPNGKYSFQYPASWTIKKGYKTETDLMIYDSTSVKQLPQHFVDILSTESSTDSAQVFINRYEEKWNVASKEPSNWYFQSQQGTYMGFYDPEGNQTVKNKNVAASDGQTLVQIETSANNGSENTIEAKILSTFDIDPKTSMAINTEMPPVELAKNIISFQVNNGPVYVANGDGQNKQLIFTPKDRQGFWDFSPDNTYLITGAGYIVNLKTNAKISVPLSSCYSWSPDGNNILYDTQEGLYMMDSDGTNSKLLTSVSSSICPVWFPSGKSFIYRYHDTSSSKNTLARYDLNNSTNNPAAYKGYEYPFKDFEANSTDILSLVISKDGSRIAFFGRIWDGSSYKTNIFLANSDGTSLQTLINRSSVFDDPNQIIFTADNKNIVFTVGSSGVPVGGYADSKNIGLSMINIQTKTLKTLDNVEGGNLAISSDGRFISYDKYSDISKATIYDFQTGKEIIMPFEGQRILWSK